MVGLRYSDVNHLIRAGFMTSFFQWPISLTGAPFCRDLEIQLRWFRRFLFLHLAARDLALLLASFDPFRCFLAVAFSLLFIASFSKAHVLWVNRIAFATLTAKFLWNFPATSNHFAIEFLSLTMLTFVGTETRDERELTSATLRWFFVWVFFFSGVQKFLHGTYVNGAFLASSFVFDSARYAWVMEPFMTPLDQPPSLDGPYRLRSLPLLLLSNSIWVGEILVGVLLAMKKTRMLGIVAALGAVMAIEAVAREVMFGALCLNLIALFASARWSRVSFWAAVLIYLFVGLTRTGLIQPGFVN